MAPAHRRSRTVRRQLPGGKPAVRAHPMNMLKSVIAAPFEHGPPLRSSGPGWRRSTGFRGAPGRIPARSRAAARRTGRGPRPRPRLPGPASQAGPGGQGARVLRAGYPLGHGQQRGVLVAGRGRVPRLPGPASEAGAGGQGARVLRRRGPARSRAAARRTGRGPRPRRPPPRSSEPGSRRAVRVRGCSGPRTRSVTGSSAAHWSRAAAASPASPVQRARLTRAARAYWCSGPRTCS